MPISLTKYRPTDRASADIFNAPLIQLENYLNERENANTRANKVVFADGQTFEQKLQSGTLRGQQGDQGVQGPRGPEGNVDTTEIRQIKSEAKEHLRKAIQLLRSVQVNVEGTVLETQFMKKSVFDNDNDGVVDRAKTADYANNYITEEFEVGGEADKFYPVVFELYDGNDYSIKHLSIYRNYNWTAPNTWNSATHRGALQLEIDVYTRGWGGNTNWLRAYWSEGYADIFGGVKWAVSKNQLIVWLRGGGAKYKAHKPLLATSTITVNLTDYNITYPSAPQHNETFPVLTAKMDNIAHYGRYGMISTYPDIAKELVIQKNNRVNLARGYNESNGSVFINWDGALQKITRYVFMDGLSGSYQSKDLADIRAKEFIEGDLKLSEKYILKSEYDKLVQRVQALESKTQNL